MEFILKLTYMNRNWTIFMDFTKLSSPKKIILGASILAILSLLFAWVDIGFTAHLGFNNKVTYF